MGFDSFYLRAEEPRKVNLLKPQLLLMFPNTVSTAARLRALWLTFLKQLATQF